MNIISGKYKILFECNLCGFTGKTSGLPKSCPKCHFNPIETENKNRKTLIEELKNESI